MSEENYTASTPEPPVKEGEQVKDFNYKEAINKSLVLQSLLYDLDLLPEQLDNPSHDWDRMLTICIHFQQSLNRSAELEKELKAERDLNIESALEIADKDEQIEHLAESRDEEKKALEWVKKNGLHAHGCKAAWNGNPHTQSPCTCGLDDLRNILASQKGEK